MRIVASACLVLAILFMVGCGTSAEDKKMIQDQGTKITALEKKTGDVERMANDVTKKMETVWGYLAANNIGKAKFPPEEVKSPTPVAPGAKTPPATPPKSPTPAKEPGKTK